MISHAVTMKVYTMPLREVPALTPSQLAALSQIMPVFAFTGLLKLWERGQ